MGAELLELEEMAKRWLSRVSERSRYLGRVWVDHDREDIGPFFVYLKARGSRYCQDS